MPEIGLTSRFITLISRDRDLTAVRKWLIPDGARLITLLGPPGIGETRRRQAMARTASINHS